MLKKIAVNLFLMLLLMLGIQSCSDDPVSPVITGTIKGRVIDADDGFAIPVASITTNPGTVSITTDDSGNYEISDVAEGSYTVRASKQGYKSTSINISVKAGETTQADILMVIEPSENTAPLPPSNPAPMDGAVDQPIAVILAWSGSDADVDDSLTYEIYFGNIENPVSNIAVGLTDTTFLLEDLFYETTYYWQVVTKDKKESVAYGPVWRFTTCSFPNNRVVFASNRDGDYAIFSASETGETIIQLTENSSRNWWPRISPNRDRIAFISDRDIDPFIYSMKTNGSDEHKLTSLPVAGYHNNGIGFCWSPDGFYLLFSHYEKLYRINADGSNLTQIATAPADRHFRECDWSPLGDKIVALTIGSWMYDSEIYLMNSDGTEMTLLKEDSLGATASPSFAPDGKKILFTHDVSGHEVNSGRQLDARIFILHIDQSDTTNVSENKPAGTNDLFPRWSPDGAKIIFTNGPNDDVAPKDIWIMDADGSNREKIIENGIMADWR